MKKMVLIVVFVSLIGLSAVHSQGYFIGGSVNSFRRSLDGDLNMSWINLYPSFGFIRNDKADIGFNLIFERYNEPYYDYNNGFNETNFGIGVFSRYTFFNIGRFSILGNFEMNYLRSNFHYDTRFNRVRETYEDGILFNIKPIFQFDVLDNLSLYTSIGLIYLNFWFYGSRYWGDNYSEFGIDLPSGISLNEIKELTIGFLYRFGTSTGSSSNIESNEFVYGESEENTRLTTTTEPDKMTIGISANPAGFVHFGPSVSFELAKSNLFSEINLIFPSLDLISSSDSAGGFGFLGTFNYIWLNQNRGVYLGGGLGYIYYKLSYWSEHMFALGANAGYKILTHSGLYYRIGGFLGLGIVKGDFDTGSEFFIKPDMVIGYSF